MGWRKYTAAQQPVLIDPPFHGPVAATPTVLVPPELAGEGGLPTACAKFSVGYSTRIFSGWVRQDSPCCAGASVAGEVRTLARVVVGL